MITRILNPATNTECYCLMFPKFASFDEINETRKSILEIIKCYCSLDESTNFKSNKDFYNALLLLSEMELSEDQSSEIDKLIVDHTIK